MAAKQFPLVVVIKGVDRVSQSLRAVQGALGKLGAVAAAVNARVRAFGVRSGVPVLGAALSRAGVAARDLGARIGTVIGLFSALGAAAIMGAFHIVQSFADAGSKINDTSIALGLSAEKLQEWQFAARMNGIDNEKFVASLSVLQRNLGKASMGQGPAVKLLKAMKIPLKDAKGQVRDMSDLLPELADKLKGIKNPLVRSAAAAALFGRSGIALMPMLLDGSVGMAALAKRARELGIIMSDESVKGADAFGDAFDQLKDSISGAKNTIGAELLPVMSKLIADLTNFVIRVRPQIQAFFRNFAKELPGRVAEAVRVFGELKEKMQPVLDAFGFLVDRFGGANVIIGTVAGAIAIFLVPALYACATAVYALGTAILFTPVGWILAGIVAIVAAMVWLYNSSETARKIIYEVGSAFSDLLGWMFSTKKFTDLLTKTWEAWKPILAVIGEAFTWLWDNITNGFSIAIDWVKDFADTLGNMVPDWVKNLFSSDSKTVNINGASGGAPLGAASAGRAGAAGKSTVAVTVDLGNLPPGSRVKSTSTGRPDFALNQGYAMARAGHE